MFRSQQLDEISEHLAGRLEVLTEVVRDRLQKLLGFAREVRDGVKKMATDLTKLTEEVTEIKTVSQSAITLIQGISQRLEEAKTDPVKIQALADELDATSAALAAAVAANTPASEEPAPTPTPEPTPEEPTPTPSDV